jgi:hypothetical protein
MHDALISAISVVSVAVVGYFGTRFVARATKEVGEEEAETNARKVDQQSFDRFVTRYERERERDQRIITETRRLLRSALRYVNILRGDMRQSVEDQRPLRVVRPMPTELRDLPWDLLDDGTPPPATGGPVS